MSDKEVRVKITGDISDLLKKLEKIKDAFEDLGDGKGSDKFLNNIVDDLQKVQKEADAVETNMEDIVSTTKKIDDKAFNNMADGIGKTNKQVNEFTVGITKANEQMQTLVETGEQVQDIFKKTSKDFDINAIFDKGSDKGSNSFFSNIIDGFISGTVAGEKMSHTFEGIRDSIGTMTNSLKDITDGLDMEKVVKAFDELPKSIDTTKKSLEGLYEERKKLQVLANEVEDVFEEDSYTESAKRAQETLKVIEELIAKEEALLKAQQGTEKQSLNKLKNYSKYYEDLSAKVKEFINDETQGILVREKVAKSFAEVTKSMENMYKVQKEGSPDKSHKAMMEDYDALIEKVKDLRKELAELKETDKIMSDLFESFTYEDLNSLEKLRENLKDLIKTRRDYVKSLDDIDKAERDEIKRIWELGDARAGLEKQRDDSLDEQIKTLEILNKLADSLAKIKKVTDDWGFEILDPKQLEAVGKMLKGYDSLKNSLENFKNLSEDCENGIEDFTQQIWDGINGLSNYSDATKNTKDRIAEIENEIKDYVAQIKELEQAQKDAAKAEEYMFGDGPAKLIDTEIALERATEAYKKQGKEIVELRDKIKLVNEGFDKVSNSNLDERINDLTNEAKEFSKSLSLIDFDTLKNGLEKVGASIEDKREKLIRFNEINKELDEASRKAMYSFNKQGESIKDFADKAGFAVEVFEELIDNARKISSDGFNIVGNEDALRRLERQKQLLDENNEELKNYIRILKEAGTDVPKRFIDAFNSFDFSKFAREVETFGKPMNQLTAELQSYKQQILANLRQEKENAEAMRESAKAAKEKAEATLDNAKSQVEFYKAQEKNIKSMMESRDYMEDLSEISKDYADNQEKLKQAQSDLAKAQEQYANANEKLSKIDKDRIERNKDLVESYNDLKKAVNEMGAEFDEITKGDIAKFDKSLATMLDDIFPDDLPKNMADFKEDFKAMFEDIGSLELGDAFDKLKDMGASLFEKLPGWAKAASVALVALGKALKECAEAGVNQFVEGMGTIGKVGDKLFDVFRDIGSEVKDAFENITDMDLDLGSIIEQCVEFEGTITKAGVAAEAAGDDFGKLESKARELGATSRYSATDVATAMDELATAGWSVEDILTGIDGVVNLSEGSFMDLGKAAEFVANGLTAMGMETNQANDLVDILSQAAVKTSTDVNQMQRAFTNAASVAGTLGVSATDLSTALGLMADQGVKGAKAGTALKNFMANMAAPTEKMTKCLKEYGLEGVQADIVNGKLMDGVIKLKQSFDDNNLSMKEQLKVITTLAGREALPGIAALMNNTTEEMNSLRFAVDTSTKSSRAYAESLGLVNKEGKATFESFSAMTDEQKKAYEQWENFNKVLNESADYMTMVGGSTTDLGAIVHKLGADGEVTSDQVASLVDIFYKMKGAGEEVTTTLNSFGVEIAKTDEGTMDFGETVKNLGSVWDGLNDSQKQQLITQLGVETSVEELNELFSDEGDKIEDLIDAYENMQGVSEHLAESFNSTLKGALLNLASAIEERFLQAFDKIKPAVMNVTDTLTTGFNIWNGLADDLGSGFLDAMEYVTSSLELQSQQWGQAIADGLHQAINTLDEFVNSSSFDNMLQIGTNIINGIADGIQRAANDGSLDSAISTAIGKVGTWFSDNLDTIVEVGGEVVDAICQGIEENSDVIGEALVSVMNMQTDLESAINYAKWEVIGQNIGTFIAEGIQSVFKPFFAGVEGFGSGFFGDHKNEVGQNFNDNNELVSSQLKDWGLSDGFAEGIANILFPKKELAKEKGKEVGQGFAEGTRDEIVAQKTAVGDTVDNNFKEAKVKTDQTASEIGTGISDNIMAKLETMDAAQLRVLGEELQSLQEVTGLVATGMTTSFTQIQDGARTSFMGLTNIMRNQMTNCTNIVRNQCLNMANAFRTEFVNMSNIANNQFMNVANNIRTQMVNCTNIVRNQALSMANIFRNQFVNMANIARNQFLNVANIVRNQMTNCTNIVRNQALNMSNIFRNQFVNMANIVRNQMTNCTNIIRNQCVNMSNIFRNQFVNMANIVRNQMTNCTNIIRNQCVNMANIFRNQFVNMANIARNQFVNVANIVRNQMTNCANIVRNQCVNMANIFRNQFVSMANVARNQMVNISNIIRNQAVNWSNIIRNQVTNARNSLTQQMLSMAAVTRTQMVNITNIIRNQSTQWASLVQSGASRAKSSFSSSFSGLASVARSQMANCLSIVKSYMNQIAAATSKTMTMNFKVNKTTTTTNITKNVTQGARATMGNINTNMRGIAQPSTMSTSMSNGSINLAPANNGISGSLALEVPVMLDGREIARASASYSKAELDKLDKRSKRRRGEN